uniref:PH domain-containing protein n=1 Tax=Eutreptiella gymnastica TaxID=73025 RepID=A0A7S1IK86_9EUGL
MPYPPIDQTITLPSPPPRTASTSTLPFPPVPEPAPTITLPPPPVPEPTPTITLPPRPVPEPTPTITLPPPPVPEPTPTITLPPPPVPVQPFQPRSSIALPFSAPPSPDTFPLPFTPLEPFVPPERKVELPLPEPPALLEPKVELPLPEPPAPPGPKVELPLPGPVPNSPGATQEGPGRGIASNGAALSSNSDVPYTPTPQEAPKDSSAKDPSSPAKLLVPPANRTTSFPTAAPATFPRASSSKPPSQEATSGPSPGVLSGSQATSKPLELPAPEVPEVAKEHMQVDFPIKPESMQVGPVLTDHSSLVREHQQRAQVYQKHRSSCDHVRHHLLWHLEQQRALTQSIHGYFAQRDALDQQYAGALRKLAPIPVSSTTPATLQPALAAMSSIPAKTAEHYEKMSQALAKGPATKLAQLASEMDSSYNVIKNQFAKALAQFTSQFQEIEQLHNALQREIAGAFHREDPYLLGLQIQKALASLPAAETNVTNGLGILLHDVRRIHTRNVEHLKTILNEYYKVQRLSPMGQLTDIEAVVAVVAQCDMSDYQATVEDLYQSLSDGSVQLQPEDDVDAKLLETVAQATKASTLPFRFNLNTLVQCEGNLQRRTTILGWWKQQRFVLTTAGFLHYFSSDSLTPDATLALSKCRIDVGEEPDTFTLTEVNMLMDSRTVVKCASTAELQTWVQAITAVCRK